MEQTKEFEGVWWIPDKPERRVPGRLRYSAAGAQLDLFGALSEGQLGLVGADRLPVVFGATDEEDQITILSALRTRATLLVDPDFARQSFVSSTVIAGAHVASWDDFQISACRVELTQLEEWVDVGGLAVQITDPKAVDADDDFLFRVTYRRLELPAVPVGTLTFTFQFAISVPLVFNREISLREATSLLIETTEPRLYKEISREVLWPVRNLITLATDRPSVVTETRVRLAGTSQWADILEQHRPVETESKARMHMLFGYSQVKDRLSSLLESWLSLYAKLAPALNALFSVIYSDLSATDTKFLNVAQAAEGYHRRSNPLPEAQLKAHEASVAAVVAAVPEDERVWLSRKLENSSGPTFTERVEDLFMRLGLDFLKPMFPTKKNVGSGSWRIGDWRNKLTHMRAEPEEISNGIREIHACTNQLLIALKANLLLDLGFASEEVARAFQHDQTYLVFSRRDAPF